jgi:hypothetical protein
VWLIVVLALAAAPAHGSEAAGEIKLPVVRDTWFSNVGREADANLGGAPKLKVKSYQEMSVIDIDPGPLRGRVVREAKLHLRLAGTERLLRVTVGTIAADWVEGTSARYEPQAGSSTHNHRRHPDTPWSYPGSDLCSVILGQAGTLWRMADASPPDSQGWQDVAVDPAVVAARVAGISHGLLLFDDTGSEWTRDGEKFTLHHMPNRFVMSRESGAARAPYLTVVLGAEDAAPPRTPADLQSDAADLPAGEVWVSWITPEDEGTAGTVGFFVSADGRDVPRYLIPRAGKPGERVRLHLRDLDFKPGAEIALQVRAVDGAGNQGAALGGMVRASSRVASPLPGTMPPVAAGSVPLPRLDTAEVAIIDELDKVQPVTGALIPRQEEAYLAANHLWNAQTKQVTLHAARNEFVAFQVVMRGSTGDVEPSLSLEPGAGEVAVRFGRYRNVATSRGPLPDPIVPLAEREELLPGERSRSLHCEIYVPHSAAAGTHSGTLTLRAGDHTLTLGVVLRVWDFTLPDYLSFLPEMNCYGLPRNERDYYRLAHQHRTVLDRVPYSQNGTVADGCAPHWDGRQLDWSAWDRRFGPYLDGSAFADLPRRGVPLECFYLPLHENWPSPMEGNYSGSYWADRAFPADYRRDFVTVARLFAEHFNAQRWGDTLFLFYLNGKNNFKQQGWSRGSSPWLLDEPANFQDFWALRYFGAAFHEGIRQARGPAKLVFRGDISRPQWQRDALDGLLDYNVVSSAMRSYPRIVFDRKPTEGQIVLEYGGTNGVEESNMQPLGWCLDAWSRGTDGVVPWQTVGRGESWQQGDRLSLFYPGRVAGAAPVASVRLKAYRRGQQDVEYLTLLSQLTGEPRWAMGQRVREALRLSAERSGTGLAQAPAGVEDAGVIRFTDLRPEEVWGLRVRLGEVLSAAHPPPRRRLVELRTPPRDPAPLEGKNVAVPPPARYP